MLRMTTILDGIWKFTVERPHSEVATPTVTFRQTSADFVGEYSTRVGQYPLKGHLDGMKFVFGVSMGKATHTFTGTASPDKKMITGTLIEADGKKGTFTGVRPPSAPIGGALHGVWSFSLKGSKTTGSSIVKIQQTGAELNGEYRGVGAPCPLSGSVEKNEFVFTAVFGSVMFHGSVDPVHHTVKGTFTVRNGERGDFTGVRKQAEA
jgi:hypothetical protein